MAGIPGALGRNLLDRGSRTVSTGPVSDGSPTKTLDDDTFASDPGEIVLSHRKLRVLRPDLYGLRGAWQSLLARLGVGFPQRVYVAEQLQAGDSRAAVVVSTDPLLIAAYTDELDCVAMLRFPQDFVHQYGLSDGTRLLTVNCYGDEPGTQPDLIPGPDDAEQWTGFHPVIAEFVTDDLARVEARKSEIEEAEWQKAHTMGKTYLRLRPGVARDGRPVAAGIPATLPTAADDSSA